jgi:hypothetical protein
MNETQFFTFQKKFLVLGIFLVVNHHPNTTRAKTMTFQCKLPTREVEMVERVTINCSNRGTWSQPLIFSRWDSGPLSHTFFLGARESQPMDNETDINAILNLAEQLYVPPQIPSPMANSRFNRPELVLKQARGGK